MFTKLQIPNSNYAKFECGPGVMPKICIDAWQKIWHIKEVNFGGKRRYITDFEIYDDHSSDPTNAVFNIYISIKK